MKEHQETIDKLRGIVSQKTDEISNMQIELENSDAALKAQVFCFKLLLSNREFESDILCNETRYELAEN